MPELSKPLIAVIGVLVSIAILFIAVLGILPFLQGTISGVSQTAQFSVVASAATTGDGGINTIIITVTVQKLSGVGTYFINESDISITDPNGNTEKGYPSSWTYFIVNTSFNTDNTKDDRISVTQSNTFTITIKPIDPYTLSAGNWAIVITIRDSSKNPVQTLSVTVPVS